MQSTTAEGGNVSLKKPPHPLRRVLIVVAAIGAVVLIWGFSRHWSKEDTSELGAFDSFRAVYADKCGTPSYAGAAPKVIRDDYLKSQPIRDEISRQLAALNAGASCQDVASKLKTVDFAVPAPGSG